MKSLIIIMGFISLISLFIIPVYASDIDFRYQYKESWERLGELHPSQLRGIVIDSMDNLYVIDSNKLLKLTSDNQLIWSVTFDVYPSGELFLNQNDEVIVPVSHKEVKELKKYSKSGELVKTWNVNDFEITPDTSFYLYVDKYENIYVIEWVPITSDSTNILGTLKKFDTSGELLKTYENIGLVHLIDDKGNIYTTEPGKIIKHNPNGNKIAEYGKAKFRGGPGTFFQHAETIIIDSNGIIFATGGQYGPINIFDEDGNFSSIGSYGIEEGRYGWPRGIALDSENIAYVTDYSREKILVYERILLEKSLQELIEQVTGLKITDNIPDWIKNPFLWYEQGKVSEDELLNAIQFLFKHGILEKSENS